ncbi:MAG: ribosomal protein [Thermoleophilia bacterium]|nr:ribosomal protein [Thermoleophilia bacterium]
MPDESENVNETEETEDAAEVEAPHAALSADAEAVGDEEVPAAPEPEVVVGDEPVEPEPAEDPEPMAAEASELEPEPDAAAEPAEPEADPEPMAAEAEPVAEADEPAIESVADVEELAAPAEVAAEPAGAEAAPARKKKKRLPRSLRPQRTKAKREKPAERSPISRLPKPEHSRGRRQERQGRVVSASADKTIVVRVDIAKVHPRYKKVVKRSSRFHAHDEENQAKVGDIVRIVETRPLSRMKRWRLQEIVEAAK